MIKLNGVIETALYTAELQRSRKFYENVLGLELLGGDERFLAFNVAQSHVLLIFLKGASNTPTQLPGGIIPAHDGDGPVHLGFSISSNSIKAWEDHLAANGVVVEGRTTWERGGKSIYFRDPDGHLLELLTPGVWEMY